MSGRIIRQEVSDMLELPEVGRLHIGIKSEKGYPQSIDYFRPTGKYAPIFQSSLGDKPQTIQIIFPSDDAARVCNERYEFRDNTGALVAKGDGRDFEVWNGKIYAPFNTTDHPDLMERIASKYPKQEWSIVLTMRFIVPAVRGIVGVWQFSTKGKASSIRNIRESFDTVQIMRGTVCKTVFDLSVQFAKSNKPGQNSRYPVVTMIANDTRIAEIRDAIKPVQDISLLLPER